MSTQRVLAAIVVLFLSLSSANAQAPAKPVVDGPEGKEAFDDLARFYADRDKPPPFADAIENLQAKDAATRAKAGKYLLSLFRQSFADEDNGRAVWRKQPFFGGGSQNDARDFRHVLAEAFGDKAGGEEAIPAVRWLLDEERVADNQKAAGKVLERIEGPKANALLKELLTPHPNAEVATAAVKLAGKRKLKELAPEVERLCGHYRKSLREAAFQVATNVFQAKVLEFVPEKAFTPALEKQLGQIASMVFPQPPKDASWVAIRTGQGKETIKFSGWLLEKDGLRLLDWFGEEIRMGKKGAEVMEITLADTAKAIRKLREDKDNREALEMLSRRGMLTGQFEPRFISQPEYLVGVWAWQKGDKKTAAMVLFPCIDEMRDDRWLIDIARDLFGHMYHQAMLEAFSHNRDYDKTFALARHLSQPVFDDYQYQKRAVRMAEQLPKRMEDFKTFVLPKPQEWQALSKKLARPEQIKYLAERMRLLNCQQHGQPGGVSYRDKQFRRANDPKSEEVINPYVQLLEMKLQVADLPALVPFLADDSYMLVYSYWRDFHPGRDLHMANWATANLVNHTAKHDLAQLRALFDKDEAGKKAHLEKIIAWCKENAGKTTEELLLGNLREAKKWDDFSSAADELIDEKNAKALPILLERGKDFPKQQPAVAEMVYRIADKDAVKQARQWLDAKETPTRFWASLILLRHGDKDEGLKPLQEVLAKDDGTNLYPRAIDDLLAVKTKPAGDLAAGIFKTIHFATSELTMPVVHRLFLAGRKEALDFLLFQLDNQDAAGTVSGEYKGKEVKRESTRADRAAAELAAWRTDDWEYPSLAPDKERRTKQEELKKFLQAQFERIRNNEAPMMRTKLFPLRYAEWQLDAP